MTFLLNKLLVLYSWLWLPKSEAKPYQFRAAFCSILVKVHVLSGDDPVSKVGTKHAVLTCNPLSLTNFAETDSLTTVDISVVERYLVKVLAGARSNTTADTFVNMSYGGHFK